MEPLTFKQYLRKIEEDAEEDLNTANTKKQTLLMRKNVSDQQFDRQIAPIDRTILQKEKQKQVDDKKKADAENAQLQQQKAGTTTTTPGSTGSQTPGVGSSSAAAK